LFVCLFVCLFLFLFLFFFFFESISNILKPANFLVDDNMRVVVADFGLSHGFGATAEESSFENDFQGRL
jgi:hypothetical protein